MSMRMSTLMTAGLLGALLALGPAAHAGDGCTKDKKSSQAATLLDRVQAPAAAVGQAPGVRAE